MELLYIQAFDLGAEHPQVADGDIEGAGLRLALGVLPYLEPASALQVHGYAGVTLLRLVAGIAEHPFGDGVVLEDAGVESEMLDEPVPGFTEVDGADSDLLDPCDVEICHGFSS